jgi:iron(III) transport system permease protein
MIPEITVAALLVFLTSLADFSTPIIIGGNFQTLASDLYIQITGLYNMKTAAISGMFLFIPCFLAFFLQKYFAEKKVYYSSVIAGKTIEYRNIPKIVKGLLLLLTGLFILFVFCQLAFIMIGAFTEHWGYDYTPTLRHFEKILTQQTAPFINSVQLAIIVSTVSSVFGVLLAYVLKAKNLPLRKSLDFMATLPAAVPGILFGIGYLVTFKYPLFGLGKFVFPQISPPILLGTGIIIYLICIYRYLYVGLKAGYALMEHLDPNIELAAINLGAKEHSVFLDIIFPLLKPAFIAAFFKNFSSTMTTLGAIIFLLLPSNKVAVQQIFQIMTSSEIGDAAMMALMLSFVSLALLGLFQVLFNYKQISFRIKEGLPWVSNFRK